MEFTEEQRQHIIKILDEMRYDKVNTFIHCNYCFRKLRTYDYWDKGPSTIETIAFTCKCGCVDFACNNCFNKHCKQTAGCTKFVDEDNVGCGGDEFIDNVNEKLDETEGEEEWLSVFENYYGRN